MDSTLIIAIIGVLGAFVALVLIFELYRKIKGLTKQMSDEFSEINMDNKLSNMFSETSSLKNVDSLTKILFNNIKERFKLRANSYSELIEEIKLDGDMPRNLKETLIEFFEEIIRISYREQTITENEKEDLRRKTKLIIKTIERL